MSISWHARPALAQPSNPFGNAVVLLEGTGEGNVVSFQISQNGICISRSELYGTLLLPICNLSPGLGYVFTGTSGGCTFTSSPFSVTAGGLVTVVSAASQDARGNPCLLSGTAPPVSWPYNPNDPGWSQIINPMSFPYCPSIGQNNGDTFGPCVAADDGGAGDASTTDADLADAGASGGSSGGGGGGGSSPAVPATGPWAFALLLSLAAIGGEGPQPRSAVVLRRTGPTSHGILPARSGIAGERDQRAGSSLIAQPITNAP